MLDDGAVDAEFVLRRLVFRCRLRDQGLEDGVDDVVVPALRRGVLVGCRGGERGVAGVVADLAEARCGDGL